MCGGGERKGEELERISNRARQYSHAHDAGVQSTSSVFAANTLVRIMTPVQIHRSVLFESGRSRCGPSMNGRYVQWEVLLESQENRRNRYFSQSSKNSL